VGLVIAGVHIATGYVPGASEQTELAKLGVRIHTGLFPVFFDTIAAIILWKYYDLRGDKRVQLMAQRKKLGL
jgi:Na+/melibiose symporter-like transporter